MKKMNKLRDKKTGDIKEYIEIRIDNSKYGEDCYEWFDSLAELNEKYEDYEEPKEYWYIDSDEVLLEENSDFSFDRGCKEIGNFFKTKEEAEKAVEKLKAWKRLKDKGFRFEGYTDNSGDLFSCEIIRCNFGEASHKDLDLLFGGEE